MADGYVGVAPDGFGKKVDTSELTVGGQTVERQRIVVSSDVTSGALASVVNAPMSPGTYGLGTYAVTTDAVTTKIAAGKFRIAGGNVTTSTLNPNAYMSIINPAASTTVVYIVAFDLYISGGNAVVQYQDGAGFAPSTSNSQATGFNPNLAASATSNAVVRFGLNAPTSATTLSPNTFINTTVGFRFMGLVVVPPNSGMGLSCTGATTGTAIYGNIYWYEE